MSAPFLGLENGVIHHIRIAPFIQSEAKAPGQVKKSVEHRVHTGYEGVHIGIERAGKSDPICKAGRCAA